MGHPNWLWRHLCKSCVEFPVLLERILPHDICYRIWPESLVVCAICSVLSGHCLSITHNSARYGGVGRVPVVRDWRLLGVPIRASICDSLPFAGDSCVDLCSDDYVRVGASKATVGCNPMMLHVISNECSALRMARAIAHVRALSSQAMS